MEADLSLEHSPVRSNSTPAGHHHDGASFPDRFISEEECEKLTNLSRVTRWRLIQRGEFPAKLQISPGRKAWRLSTILRWMVECEES